jgi:AAHS family 4-hydroxybenzoate transporter-like MFS transporter
LSEVRRIPILTIALCSLASLLDGYDIQALGLSIPGMAAEFGVAPTALTLAVSASLVGMALGAMLLGPLGDRFGRKPMLVAFLMLIGVTTFGVVASTGPTGLAVWRFLSGLGMGAILPVAIAIVAEAAPAERRTALVTLMVASSPVGSFLSGFVAPLIEPVFGWRGIFGIGGALTVVAGVAVWVALPVTPVVPSGGLTPHVGSLFVRQLHRRTILLWTIFWLNLFVNYSLISWLPTLLGEAGWERGEAQRATGVLALGGVCGGLLMAWAADKGRAVPILAATYVLTAGLFVLFVLFVLGPGGRLAWLVLLGLVGAGAIGAQMALGSLAATFYPPEIRTTGLGWAGGIGRTGAIVGPMTVAALLGSQVPATTLLALLMVPMLACALCVAMLPGALRPGADRPGAHKR